MSESDNQCLQTEYEQVNENMRHYGNMRFAQMTLFAAITAGLWSAVSAVNDPKKNWDISPGWIKAIVIPIGGVVTTAIFWLMEERAADYWHYFREQAEELEKRLGCSQWKTRSPANWLSATNAARTFHAVIMLMWIWLPLAEKDWRNLFVRPICVHCVLSIVPIGVLLFQILYHKENSALQKFLSKLRKK